MNSAGIYSRVCRAFLKDGMSAREAARYFNKDRKTIAKMLRHALPSGYRRSDAPHFPTLDPYVSVIDDDTAHRYVRQSKCSCTPKSLGDPTHFY
jgi:hypothetical protein